MITGHIYLFYLRKNNQNFIKKNQIIKIFDIDSFGVKLVTIYCLVIKKLDGATFDVTTVKNTSGNTNVKNLCIFFSSGIK